MHGGVGGAVSEDDDGIGEPDGETGGDDGVEWMRQSNLHLPLRPPPAILPAGHRGVSLNCYTAQLEPLPYLYECGWGRRCKEK